MTLRLITAPTEEPITLADAKLVCGVDADITNWDTLITSLISSGREDAEQQLGRTVAGARWERVLDEFPADGGAIRLGWPRVTGIVSIVYIDAAGVAQTMLSTDYSLDADYEPGWVAPSATAGTWPSAMDAANAVRVRFDTAWGDGSTVPESVKQYIRVRVATLFKFREAIAAGVSVAELPRDVGAGLLDKWRVFS
jgi:uncharacterized phiE125 gp8 family phage protein